MCRPKYNAGNFTYEKNYILGDTESSKTKSVSREEKETGSYKDEKLRGC